MGFSCCSYIFLAVRGLFVLQLCPYLTVGNAASFALSPGDEILRYHNMSVRWGAEVECDGIRCWVPGASTAIALVHQLPLEPSSHLLRADAWRSSRSMSGGRIGSALKAMAFYLIRARLSSQPSGARLPLPVFSAGCYEHSNDVGTPRSAVISEHLAGVSAGILACCSGVRPCRYPRLACPQAVCSPQEARNVTASGPACSMRPKGVLGSGSCRGDGAWPCLREQRLCLPGFSALESSRALLGGLRAASG